MCSQKIGGENYNKALNDIITNETDFKEQETPIHLINKKTDSYERPTGKEEINNLQTYFNQDALTDEEFENYVVDEKSEKNVNQGDFKVLNDNANKNRNAFGPSLNSLGPKFKAAGEALKSFGLGALQFGKRGVAGTYGLLALGVAFTVGLVPGVLGVLLIGGGYVAGGWRHRTEAHSKAPIAAGATKVGFVLAFPLISGLAALCYAIKGK